MSRQEEKLQPKPQELERAELLKSLFDQHWQHARHLEAERHWFTTVVGILVAGILTLLGAIEENFKIFAVWGGAIVVILSVLGYLLCLTWRAPFVEHTTLANKMLEDLSLQKYAPYTAKPYSRIKIGWITAHELFLYFYALMAASGLLLLTYAGLGISFWWISLILFAFLCLLWRGLGTLLFSSRLKSQVEKSCERGLGRLIITILQRVPGARDLWLGLKRREDDYRKEWAVGQW